MKASRKPTIPEPSPRAAMWIIALAFALLCGIIVFDYAIGDSRVAWTDSHMTSKPLHFKKAG